MKRKSLLRILAVCASSSLLASSLLAGQQDQSSSPAQDKSGLGKAKDSQSQSSQGGLGQSQTGSSTGAGESQTSGSSSHKELRLSQVMGANVKSQTGETLGQINDFVVNPASGRLRFAIISLSSGPNSGKLTAVPWQLVNSSGANEFTLTADKQKLDSAQTFDATSMPDFSAGWSRQIYSYYGVQPERMGGRIPTGESSTGTGSSSDSSGSSSQQQTPGSIPRK